LVSVLSPARATTRDPGTPRLSVVGPAFGWMDLPDGVITKALKKQVSPRGMGQNILHDHDA